MKRLVLALSLVLVLCLVLAIPTFAAGPHPGRQTWHLDEEDPVTNAAYATVILPGPFQMEKNGGPGDGTQSGQVIVPTGEQAIWVADQMAMADVTFTNGDWVVDLVTDADWGVLGDLCFVEIGQWDGAAFFQLLPSGSYSFTYDFIPIGGQVGLVKVVVQTGALTVDDGKWLAVRITNQDPNPNGHIIYTGEKEFASCVSSPQTDPGYPLPELATGILLGAGILALGGFILFRRRKSASLAA
jgi:hypothetical protein